MENITKSPVFFKGIRKVADRARHRQLLDNPKFTCYYCTERDECEFAFDAYNINGNCLAECVDEK